MPKDMPDRTRGSDNVNYMPDIIVELRTPATPLGVGGGKERGGCHLNLRTCWPILRLCWPMPMRTKCCNLQHFAL